MKIKGLNFKEFYNRQVNYNIQFYGETKKEAKNNINTKELKKEYKDYLIMIKKRTV